MASTSAWPLPLPDRRDDPDRKANPQARYGDPLFREPLPSALVVASIWQRAVRVHAGIRAVVSQVATEYGLLPINSRKLSGFSADAEPSSEAARPIDAITTTTEK